MKIICGPEGFDFVESNNDLNVLLYQRSINSSFGSVGAAVKDDIYRQKLVPSNRAWDLLSLALSVVAADRAGHRRKSSDGWTRDFDLTVAVIDANFWNQQKPLIELLLKFLTTDRWSLNFVDGGLCPKPHAKPVFPDSNCVALLSGGLDSFVGLIDLLTQGKKPFLVSQRVRGDGQKQQDFASLIERLNHFQTNHNASVPNPESPASQRSRSIIFLAYGVLIATTLKRYQHTQPIDLYVCENGFISINPPLTPARIGSLSTRTTHPVVFSLLQDLLNKADLNVRIINPYQHKTKGEMLTACLNQPLLEQYAYMTTSCGRFGVFNNKHCGRCVPCIVRRAAFQHWKGNNFDTTPYVYNDLSIDDDQHSGFDDVRSMLMAILARREKGTSGWVGAGLSSGLIQNKQDYINTVERGLLEIEALMLALGVQ